MKRIFIYLLIFVFGCAGQVPHQGTTPTTQQKSTNTKNNTSTIEPAWMTLGIILGAGLIAALPAIISVRE